jgi:hypothetical protein
MSGGNPGLEFVVEGRGGREPLRLVSPVAIIAGWTGRHKAAVEKHIAELEALGVKRPATTPIYYRVAARRLVTADTIEVSGPKSSGEVEFVMVRAGGRLLVGVGSDHTDREVETYGVTVSKQMCDKPVAPLLWDYTEVKDHWDALVLRSWIEEGGRSVLYQEGLVAAMLPPEELIAGYDGGSLPEGAVMFCGTLAAIGGIRPSPRFRFEIEDPVLGRRIAHAYAMVELPMLG